MNPIVTVPVGCNAMVTRWYFDPREATCRSYVTCPQYGNNFPSERVCLDICAPTQPLRKFIWSCYPGEIFALLFCISTGLAYIDNIRVIVYFPNSRLLWDMLF